MPEDTEADTSDAKLKELLLDAPQEEMDDVIRDIIQAWKVPIHPVEVLHALDMAIYGASASSLVILALEAILYDRLEKTGMDFDAVVAKATWRTVN